MRDIVSSILDIDIPADHMRVGALAKASHDAKVHQELNKPVPETDEEKARRYAYESRNNKINDYYKR
jgi:hypothetical protein